MAVGTFILANQYRKEYKRKKSANSMITIIHGSDTAQSRKYFLDEKQKDADGIMLDADKVNLTDLAQIFGGGGLFAESKSLFIEQFITKRKKSGDYKDIIATLEQNGQENAIFLWENKDLEISALKSFKNPIVRAFKLPQTLFILMDSIKPGNGKVLLKLFHQTIANTETEMVFFMLIRQFRLLLGLSDEQESDIDELKRMAPWQKGKLQKQAAAFTPAALKKLYQRLFAIESGQKTGTLSAPLVSAIDFLLLEV